MGWFDCAGTVIGPDGNTNSYVISQLSKSQKECRYGKGKIILEKFLYRRNDGIAVHEVIDEIDIESNSPEKEYNWTTCKVNGVSSKQLYLIYFKDQRQAELTAIWDLWEIDFKLEKFVKVENVERVTCVNPDYSDEI